MSADAIARLREKQARCDKFRAASVDVEADDLRALLDAHAEALDVLARKVVDVSADRTLCSLCRTEAFWNLEPDRADRHPHAVSCVLAKAGRR